MPRSGAAALPAAVPAPRGLLDHTEIFVEVSGKSELAFPPLIRRPNLSWYKRSGAPGAPPERGYPMLQFFGGAVGVASVAAAAEAAAAATLVGVLARRARRQR